MAGRKKIYDETKTISFRIHPSWEKDVKELIRWKLRRLKKKYIEANKLTSN